MSNCHTCITFVAILWLNAQARAFWLRQELERAFQNAKARGEEVLAAQAKAENSLGALEHKHSDVKVRLLFNTCRCDAGVVSIQAWHLQLHWEQQGYNDTKRCWFGLHP